MTNQNQTRDRDEKSSANRHQFRDGDRVKVRCVEYDMGFTSEASGGKEQLGLSLEITEGPAKGYILSTYLFFTDGAVEYTLKKMQALGWNADWNNLDTLKSEEASATIEIERDRDGKETVRVGWINRAGVAMKEKMNNTQRASFANRMKAVTARVLGQPAGGNDDRKLGNNSGGGRPAPREEGGYDYRREQEQSRGRGGDRYGDAPPPSDDDRPPYERGGNSGRRW